nr:HAD-IIIC family phosphatase [Methylobacterium goesingense]
MAADQGLSKKCLVLDLDNTLWGGVVGDDGLGGIVLGQGSAEGEAYVNFQAYARDLSMRGIILAIVSKNDEANALAVFRDHPEMVLRREDIAVFFANWDDKAQNLRRVASALGIGLDALVFVDDNPFERELVRAELPMVAVPELPEDPALYAPLIASAGYFEALSVTAEDRARASYYRSNTERSADVAQAANLPAYLASLAMTLSWRLFDDVGLNRIVQLINKTNQFNLTTRRTTDAEARMLMDDPEVIGLQFRLVDRFGDNGMIGVIVARRSASDTLTIENWLMSCRVLGRRVEAAMLEVLVQVAIKQGIRHLIGCYRPSAKNGIVAKHYENLGFTEIAEAPDGSRYCLNLDSYVPEGGPIEIARG